MRSQHILRGGCNTGKDMTLLQRRGAPFEGLEGNEGTVVGISVYFPVVRYVIHTRNGAKMSRGNSFYDCPN
jgi:hypothetical protein